MRVHRRRREHAGDRDPVFGDVLVGQEQLALALAHRLFGFVADALDRGAQLFGAAIGVEGAVDFGRSACKMRAQPRPMLAGQHRRIEHEHAVALILGIEDVGEIAEARLERHDIAFAQGIDRRVRAACR
ncbi:hypothetical protein WR25_16012 [Diploscapter pachys]|uniref:Uncharacterized protein n=1 Tax=Diploscapter pachys TaxID=2018661 RepID=A0A2A2M5I9_9BILA|nr:hypothetical protein WR25_16012 [Diploscapter pachys]